MSFAFLPTISVKASNTWSGGGGSTNWSDDANWGGAQPTYGTLTFDTGGTQGTTSVVNQAYSMNQLLWTGSSAWTVNNSGGFGITLYDDSGTQAKIENQSTGLVTLNAPITFAATSGAAWGEINAVNGDLTFGSGGTISVTGSALNELRFYGSGRTVTVNSVITAGSRKLVVGPNTTDNNTVILNAANSYSGNTEVNVGTVQVGNNTALGTSIAYLGNGGSTYSNLNSALLLNASGLTVSNQIVTNKADSGAGLGTGTRTIGGNFTSGSSTFSGNIYLNGGAVLAAGNGGTVTFSGIIQNGTDTGNVSRDLAINSPGGTVVLSGVNTYTGKTSITGGTVSIAADSGLGAAPGAAVANQLTLNGGTLRITAAAQTLNANRGITLGSSGGTFDTSPLSTAGTTTIGGIIAGTGPLTLKSNGDMTATGGGASGLGIKLNATNTFTGDVTITSGLVSYASNASFGNSANNIILNGGGLLDANTSTALSRNIQVLSGGGTFRTWGTTSVSWTGAITGSGNINRTDGGTLSLTGNLSGYTGTYNNQGGTTKFINGANVLTGTLTVSAGEASIENTATNTYTAVNLNGGTLRIKSNNNALGGVTLAVAGSGTLATQNGSTAITLANNATISGTNTLSVDAGYANITWNGNVSGTGTKLRVSSSGTLTLGGTINMGSTSVGNVGVESTGTMTLASTASVTAGTVYNSSTGILNLGGGTVSAGTISNSSTGTLNLNGSTATATTVSNTAGGTLSLTSGSLTTTNLNNSSTGILNLNGATIGATSISQSGNGAVNISAGTITTTTVATTNTTGTLTISGGTLNTKYFNIGNASSTSGRVVQTGGTVNVLSGDTGFRLGHWNNNATAGSSYNLSGGVLDATGLSANAAGSGQLVNIGWDGQGDMIVGGGAGSATLKAYGIQLDQNGNSTTGSNSASTGNMTLTLSANGVAEVGAGGIAQASTLDNIILNGGTLRATANSTWAATMTANTSTTSTLDSNSGFTATASGVISGAGNLTKAGLGTVTLSAANTYTGVTTLSTGTLSVATIGNGAVASGNLGSATNAATNLVFDGGTLQYTGATASTDRNFTINTGKTATFSVTTNNLTVSGASASTNGALTKIGAGTLTLSGANAHTGATTITAGTLSVGASNNLGASASNLVFDGGTLQVTGTTLTAFSTIGHTVSFNATKTVGIDINNVANTFTVDQVLNQTTGGLTKSGAGILALSSANTYTGTTTVSAGTLRAGIVSVANTSGAFGNNSAVVMANTSGAILDITGFNTQIGSITGGGTTGGNVTLGAATLTLGGDNTSPAAYAGVISGTGAITKIGTGTQILSGASTYSGLTTISAGTLEMQAKSTDATYTIAQAGTLKIGYTTAGGYASTNVKVNGNGVSATTGLYLKGGTSYNAQGKIELITGPTTIRQYGTGLATIGMFDVNFDGLSTTAAASGSVIDSNVQFISRGYGMTVSVASGSATATGDLVINSGLNLTLAQSSNTLGFYKRGAGSIALNATANTANVSLRLEGGSVITGAVDAIGPNATVVTSSGTKLLMNGFNQAIGSLSGSGQIVNGSATATLLTVNQAAAQTFSGVIGGSTANDNNLALTKTGSSTLTLSGNNTFTGTTAITAGVLNIQHANALGSTAAGTTVSSGAQLQIQGGITTAAEALSLSGTGISSDGALRNISGNNTFAGTITLAAATRIQSDAGTLTLSSALSLGASNDLNIGGVGNTTLSGTVTSTGGVLTKDGSGSLTMNGANNTSDITINAGTLFARGGNFSTAFAADKTITVNTGGTLDTITHSMGSSVGGGGNVPIVNLNGGTWVANNEQYVLTLGMTAGTTSGAGEIRTLSGATYTVNAASTSSTISTGISLYNNLSLVVNDGAAADDLVASGYIANTATITKSGAGTMLISGATANTFTGAFNINAGVVRVEKSSGLGTTATGTSVAGGAALQLANNITVGAEALTLNGTGISGTGALRNVSGNNSYGGAITLGSATRINSDSGTLTLGGNVANGSNQLTLGGNGDTTLSGAIGSGSGGLTKDGSGKVTLTGTSTYTGATLVSAGTMLVNGSLAGTSDTTVSSGATLGGTGSIANGVTVVSGGTLSPGASIESLGLGSLDLDGALLIEWDTTVSPNIDLLNIASTLNLGSNSSVTFTNLGAGSLDLNTPYVFATYGSGGLTGTFNTVNFLPVGFTLDYNYGGLNQIAIVPEPSALLITVLLSLPPLLRRKRNHDTADRNS